MSPDQLRLALHDSRMLAFDESDGFEEGFHRSIIIAISLTAHPLPGSVCLQAREGILRSRVGAEVSDNHASNIGRIQAVVATVG